MRRCFRAAIFFLFLIEPISAQFFIPSTVLTPQALGLPPKKEFRAAWVATVANFDWPSSRSLSTAAQQTELISILDRLKSTGFNAVIFQIRCEADAFYQSSIEPWSYWLTGQQGAAPNPFYDPLQFAVDEAHKRGMELHAWFNPYRADRGSGYAHPSNHVTVLHPDWVIAYGTIKILDPGLPAARTHVANVMMDVVRRYDIDGVHWDDYFYPYPPTGSSDPYMPYTLDAATFAANNPNNLTQANWRRDNVNKLVQMVHDSIQVVKPWVKFGISPFGIWKSGVPSGIVGLSAYDAISCDAPTWLANQWIDYITPQLYWKITGSQDYSILMPWWGTQLNGRHFYPGQAAYRIADASNWPASELPNQINLNRANANVQGSVFFRALVGVLDNPKGFADSLKNNFYKYPAIVPTMAWKDTMAPNTPGNLQYAQVAGSAGMTWDKPSVAFDGDTASRYAIYRFDHASVQPTEIADARNLASIEGTRLARLTPMTGQPGPFSYVVTSVDRNGNESGMSLVLTVQAPQAPLPITPAANAMNVGLPLVFSWLPASPSNLYSFETALDSVFTLGKTAEQMADTFKVLTVLQGQQKYFWRVNASNAGGTGNYAAARSFFTGFPAMPVLVSPRNYAPDTATNLRFSWAKALAADSYRFQLAGNALFSPLMVDTSNYKDTSIYFPSLAPYTYYFWRVTATNGVGPAPWSEIFRFRTGISTLVANKSMLANEFRLEQNYPNPFNPTTTISFSVPADGNATLKIYDVLGRELLTLVDEWLAQGKYDSRFDASGLPSGVYFYRLVANGKVDTKKMQLIR
ncbi:MAG: family 10 glycosylhydrolase [Ignavibacteriales bacterium]|nr:family 10 glycosylhydrolase [Ignavibacteriales bacterium]